MVQHSENDASLLLKESPQKGNASSDLSCAGGGLSPGTQASEDHILGGLFFQDEWEFDPNAELTPTQIELPAVGIDYIAIEWDFGQAFNKFRLLPRELRREIWKFAFPEPRVLIPTFRSFAGSRLGLTLKSCSNRAGRQHLCTTRESREVFLEHYTSVDFLKRVDGEPLASLPFVEYVDVKRDTLVFQVQDIASTKERGLYIDATRLTHVAIGDDDDQLLLNNVWFRNPFKWTLREQLRMGRLGSCLQTLDFVYGKSTIDEDKKTGRYALVNIDETLKSAEIKYSEDDDRPGWLARAENDLSICVSRTNTLYHQICEQCFLELPKQRDQNAESAEEPDSDEAPNIRAFQSFRISLLAHVAPEYGTEIERSVLRPKCPQPGASGNKMVLYTEKVVPRKCHDILLYEWNLVMSGRGDGKLDTMYDGIAGLFGNADFRDTGEDTGLDYLVQRHWMNVPY